MGAIADSVRTIPVIDFTDLISGDAARESNAVAALGQSLELVGFFALINHGVDTGLIKDCYRATTAFFELPEETKRQYEHPHLQGQRGFIHFGKEHAKDQPFPDLKEFWHIGRDVPETTEAEAASMANLWPSEIPDFQPLLLQLYEQLDHCAEVLLVAIARYLKEPDHLLADMARGGATILRLIHYPPIPSDAAPQSIRAAAHEDINLITLLCEATADGLELLQRDGQWLAIPALPGQIIVDAGDMLQQLSNGLFRSTTHRVTNPSDDRERRFSMPFFVHPRREVDLSPLPSCVARTGGRPRFPQITAADYLAERLREIGLAASGGAMTKDSGEG